MDVQGDRRGVRRSLARRVIAILASWLLPIGIAQTAATSFQGPLYPGTTQPLWFFLRDSAEAAVLSTQRAGPLVFFLFEGRLHAIDPDTSDTVWEYGFDLEGPLFTSETHEIVLFSQGASTIALDAATGEKRWRKELEAGDSRPYLPTIRFVLEDLLLVTTAFPTNPLGFVSTAMDVASGIIRYELGTHLVEGEAIAEEHGLLIGTAGAGLHGGVVIGYDLETGVELWHIQNVERVPLWITNGKIYFNDVAFGRWPPMRPYIDRRIIVFDVQTGEVSEVWTYLPRPDLRIEDRLSGYDIVAMTDDAVLMSVDHGARVLAFDWGGGDVPRRSFGPYDPVLTGPSFLAGPIHGHLLFRTRDHTLLQVPLREPGLINGRMVDAQSWSVPGTAPISRLDILDGEVYLGRTDGTFDIISLSSGAVLLHSELAAGGFERTLFVDNFVVVQRPGALAILRR